jgi:hypothetical protein
MSTRPQRATDEERDRDKGRERNRDGDKDHSQTDTIIVNTREHTVEKNKEISFEEVVSLAYDGNPPTGPYIEFSVMYRRGQGNKDGSLIAGQTVKVKDGMVFNVSATDRS